MSGVGHMEAATEDVEQLKAVAPDWFEGVAPVIYINEKPQRHDECEAMKQMIVECELGKLRASGERSVSEGIKSGEVAAVAESAADHKCAGDVNLDRLYATLAAIDAADYPRSHHQRKFHESFIKASLRSIYTDDYAICEKRLQARYDTDYINPIVMIVTPRRFGKTYSVAQYVAAYSAAIHGKEVAIFSTGRRASKKMLDLVMKFLVPLIKGKKRIYTRNVEEVIVEQLEPPYLRNKVCSYPAKVQVCMFFAACCVRAVILVLFYFLLYI